VLAQMIEKAQRNYIAATNPEVLGTEFSAIANDVAKKINQNGSINMITFAHLCGGHYAVMKKLLALNIFTQHSGKISIDSIPMKKAIMDAVKNKAEFQPNNLSPAEDKVNHN
jgi:hypothetical protein